MVSDIGKVSRRTFLKLSSTLVVATTLRPFSSIAQISSPLPLIERATFTMGSIVTIKAYCAEERMCNLAIDKAFREMKTIDKLMSVYDHNSQLSSVNNSAAYKEITVDERIIEILEHARRFAQLTNGAFDVTIEPLMELYGFRDERSEHHFPSDKRIASKLDGIGMNNIVTDSDRSTVHFTHDHTKIDLGGIAVGYAIDRAVNILHIHGIKSAIINHSGDIYAIGTPPEEDAWDVGVTDPMYPESIITSIRIKDEALSTSGNYENFIEADGRTIGHLINPANGRTASSLLSGTTIARTAIEADALSTGFFVLGLERSKSIIQQSKNLQFIAVVEDGEKEVVKKLE